MGCHKRFKLYLVLGLLSGLSVPAAALNVPDSECPCNHGPYWTNPNCSFTEDICVRTDSAVRTVSAGTPDEVLGGDGQCNNCVGKACECLKDPPPPMLCNIQLSVSYTETVSSELAAGIEVGGPGIKATLESSIGHANARQITSTLVCGSEQFPPCKIGKYSARLGIQTGVQMAVDSTYGWSVKWEGSGCSFPTPQWDWWPCQGARTSTGTGSSYGSASCNFDGYLTCPADR